MNPKKKKCKGNGVTKGYGCSTLTLYRTLGLCSKCYPNWLLNSEAGKERLSRAINPIVKKRKEQEDFAKEYQDRKKLGYLLTNAKNACHEYIKLRDKGKPCISCGAFWSADFQAGHFYKAETYSTMRFLENNIFGQCRQCNMYKDGNESMYRVGLMNRYGEEFVRQIDEIALKDKLQVAKWDREKLEEIRNYYKQRIKELKH